jgi:hypothetical protein
MPNNIVKFVENFRWPIIAVAIICPYYYSWNNCLRGITVELVQTDIWVVWHPVTSDKIYGPKVFLLTKIKPEYSYILYNPTHFPGSLVFWIWQVPLYPFLSFFVISCLNHLVEDHCAIINPKTLNYWLFSLSILSVPDEGYSRNALCVLNLISMFIFLHFRQTHQPLTPLIHNGSPEFVITELVIIVRNCY